MVKFKTKTLTSVTKVNKYITKKVPMIEVIPITSGMADATIAPKIIRRRRNVNGIAIASAIFKSS